jgi:RNA polymerase sigma factor (sigma-70 family)
VRRGSSYRAFRAGQNELVSPIDTLSSSLHDNAEVQRRSVFTDTHWSVVLSAGQGGSVETAQALEQLCRTYWKPLFFYVRRRGHDAHEAQDLTQQFFARLLEKNYFAMADRQRGRFRSFLLASFNHFLANEWDKTQTQKRGGGVTFISLDAETEEGGEVLDSIADASAEKAFERHWAIEVLDQAFGRLREECLRAGKAELFNALKPHLTAEPEAGEYAALAARLGWSQGAVGVAVHRLRQRYRQLLLDQVAQTVANTNEVNDELRQVLAALGRG